jgi:hypothetical protein
LTDLIAIQPSFLLPLVMADVSPANRVCSLLLQHPLHATSSVVCRKFFATPGKHFRRNGYMATPIPRDSDMRELEHEIAFTSAPEDAPQEERITPVEDPDTILSTIVLLLACLALAVLAHAVI